MMVNSAEWWAMSASYAVRKCISQPSCVMHGGMRPLFCFMHACISVLLMYPAGGIRNGRGIVCPCHHLGRVQCAVPWFSRSQSAISSLSLDAMNGYCVFYGCASVLRPSFGHASQRVRRAQTFFNVSMFYQLAPGIIFIF